jgi:hypothetical protein
LEINDSLEGSEVFGEIDLVVGVVKAAEKRLMYSKNASKGRLKLSGLRLESFSIINSL